MCSEARRIFLDPDGHVLFFGRPRGGDRRRKSHRRSPTTALVAAEPQLFVSNLTVSFEYYTQNFGSASRSAMGILRFYGQVARDGVKLNLRNVDAPMLDPERREGEQLLSASITLDDARALFLEYQAAGVEFAQSLKTEP